MRIDKLRVGVLLENYKKEEGGAHSYYNTLIEGIADYKFDESLEFVFVAIGNAIDNSAPTNSYLFDVRAVMRKKHFLFSILNRIAKLRGIHYLPLSGKFQKSYTLRFNEEIKKKLIENDIDLIYSLTPYYNDLNYPTVVTHWDIGHKSTFSLPEVTFDNEYEFRDFYYRKYLNKAFAIICESEAGKNELCSYKNINPKKVFIAPMFSSNLVNIKVNKDEEKRILNKFKLDTKEFFIYPAQFWAHKNHFNLIIAFNKFIVNHPDVKLVLPGGDKGNLTYIKDVVTQLNIEDRIIFGGFVSNEELNVFYRNAISLVMPTLLGPTNMPPIEANALGCDVICSDFPGHRESLGDEAIYIDPTSSEEIYLAMEKVYEKRNMGNRPLPKNDINTVSKSLYAINKIFKSLLPIRKTFPPNFSAFRILLGMFISNLNFGLF